MQTNHDILVAARAQNITITTAESCTAGLISAALTDLPGSSVIFERGYVTYSNRAKIQMLSVQSDTLNRFGAVSTEVALEMARGALNASGADLAVSVTGIAGPGGSEHKPEGRVCIAVVHKVAVAAAVETTQLIEFGPLGRTKVRHATVRRALQMILDALV